VVLLGARPHGSEVEYGWIEPGSALSRGTDFYRVRRFLEKPSIEVARDLLDRRALWNTFVMVGAVPAFLNIAKKAVPDLLAALRRLLPTRKSQDEIRLSDSSYGQIPSTDFSRSVLSTQTRQLVVQRLGPVAWSDLGSCDRAVAVLSRCSTVP